jgi:hypothetical protein
MTSDPTLDKIEKQTRETLDRARRIETRLTRWLESQGLDTKISRPIWRHGIIHIHSIDTALRDILNAIPQDWNPDDAVMVYHADRVVMEVYKEATTVMEAGRG